MADDDKSIDEIVAEAIAKHDADREKAAKRAKPPKDFGDFSDRVKELVKEAIGELAAERASATDDDDEEPARGDEGGGFAKWWQGGGRATA